MPGQGTNFYSTFYSTGYVINYGVRRQESPFSAPQMRQNRLAVGLHGPAERAPNAPQTAITGCRGMIRGAGGKKKQEREGMEIERGREGDRDGGKRIHRPSDCSRVTSFHDIRQLSYVE